MYQANPEKEPMLKAAYGNPNIAPVPTGNVESLRAEPLLAPKCNDAFFAALFIVNVVTIGFFAFWKGVAALQDDVAAKSDERVNTTADVQVYSAMMGLAGIGLILAVMWLSVLLKFAEHLIRIALWTNVGLLIAFACLSIVANPFIAVLFAIMALINICYIRAVEDRIAFASANLKCACSAIASHRGIIGVAIFLLALQLVWFATWALSVLGVYSMFRDSDPNCAQEEKRHQLCGGSGAGVSMFFLLVGFYWGAQVLQNVLTCTTAGTVAAWYYQERPKNAVSGAFYRSMTTSFGSICLGSLIVAILQALQTLARYLREKAQEEDNVALCCVACLAECILNCLANLMQYFNKWAYCYVGIYGYDFRTSGQAVMNLFETRGLTAVVNDDLTGSALGIGAFGVGIITCGCGLLCAYFLPLSSSHLFQNDTTRYFVFGLVSFIIGFSMALVLAAVVTGALSTIFVCFAEDPVALSRTHPTLFSDLIASWRQFQPEVLAVAYHGQV